MADNLTTVGSLILETFEGNTRTFIFKLRQKGANLPFDASGADKFMLEIERSEAEDETPFTPIDALPTDPGADFANGIVPVTVTPSAPSPVTAEVGTYAFSLTMVTGTSEVTVAVGQLEVAERPGYPTTP